MLQTISRALARGVRRASMPAMACLACMGGASATSYRIVELPLPSSATRGQALGINAAGDVVGAVNSSYNGRDHAVIWDAPNHQGRLLADDRLATRSSRATGISDRGDVIGQVELRKVYRTHLVVWSRTGAVFPLKEWPGREWGHANDINASGLVVGQFAVGGDPLAAPVAWPKPGTMRWLGSMSPDLREGEAYAVNDAGVIVGRTYIGGAAHAFRWSPGGDLQILSSSAASGNAFDVNEAGEAVGVASGRAILWNSNGLPIDLGNLPGGGGDYLEAHRMNNLGVVIGRTQGSGEITDFLWTAGSRIVRIVDTIDPADPWYARLKSADAHLYIYDINDAGLIVGVLNAPERGDIPVLLVPEPDCPLPTVCRGPVVRDSAGRIGARQH